MQIVTNQALNYIKNNCNLVCMCSQEPTTRTEAVTTYSRGNASMSSTDFTIIDEDGSQITRLQITGKQITASSSGGANVISFVSSSDLLLKVLAFPSEAVVSGEDYLFTDFLIEFPLPTVLL